ncbi:MAG TPA: hypothetical protein PLL10_03595, partial [Elusimicrobiales bacterium]|nr:hypothetical protein [Elusimicrobiales bacterium]
AERRRGRVKNEGFNTGFEVQASSRQAPPKTAISRFPLKFFESFCLLCASNHQTSGKVGYLM